MRTLLKYGLAVLAAVGMVAAMFWRVDDHDQIRTIYDQGMKPAASFGPLPTPWEVAPGAPTPAEWLAAHPDDPSFTPSTSVAEE